MGVRLRSYEGVEIELSRREPLWDRERILEKSRVLSLLAQEEMAPLSVVFALVEQKMLPAVILHQFACDCVEGVLREETSEGRMPDQRSWDGLTVKRAWLGGTATVEEWQVAMKASREAARERATQKRGVEVANAAADAADDVVYVARALAWAASWAETRAVSQEQRTVKREAFLRAQIGHLRHLVESAA